MKSCKRWPHSNCAHLEYSFYLKKTKAKTPSSLNYKKGMEVRKERRWVGGFSSEETLRFSVGTELGKRGGCPLLRLTSTRRSGALH